MDTINYVDLVSLSIVSLSDANSFWFVSANRALGFESAYFPTLLAGCVR